MEHTLEDIQNQKSSDDEMIDIQIEDSLVRESLMAIDTSNFKEDVMNLLGFASILGLMMLVGIVGPPAKLSQTTSQFFSPNFLISFSSENLSSYFRFVSYDLKFTRKNADKPVTFITCFQYSVQSFIDYRIVHSSSEKLTNVSVNLPVGVYESQPLHIYRDRIIDYNRIEFTIRVVNAENVPEEDINTTAIVYCGSQEHTVFQVFFRIIFAIFVLVSLLGLLRQLKSHPIKLWHLEQKLTVPLLALGVLYNNPFYYFQARSPTYAFILWETIITSVFTAYFQFFILVLFDSLRYKNRKTDKCFFAPKVIYVIALFLISVIHGIYDDITSFHVTPSNSYDEVESALRWTQIGLLTIYLVWAGVTVFLAGIQIDIIERYKFYMYLATGGTSLFVTLIVHVLFPAFKLFQNSAIHFVMSFAVENSFILMMMYFHWPYEVIKDQNYADDAERENAAIEPGDFFNNGDQPGEK
ncbi:hypothetical protein TRFO_35964 [Tritrichomonas foetus]|uniref:Wntless-like transmembrane domain-containing protein n=1 Tax=Tritrichomonas foetus TaxID=1144522 RepID=A0A1J4JGG2_9EUKA|nr:hypothetical protein TRFO_35964 [Tritrichomonas foetus]|eukprot:OHS97753.1 hypothetical protein TRFO_35964 [Tritrichomonas foetus]